MTLLVAALGMALMQNSNRDLVLETKVSTKSGETTVTALLKNQGQETLRLVVDDFYAEIETALFDATGKLLPATDRRAAQGARLEPKTVKLVVLQPGASAYLNSFILDTKRAAASAGPLSWPLQGTGGQTLQVEFRYAIQKERAEQAARRGADGAEVGRWSSPRVPLATTALTLKQIKAVLSEKREVEDAGAIPLLVEALESSKEESVREYAAVSLGTLRAPAAEVLGSVLLKDKVRDVRLAAAGALRSIASVDALEALLEASRKDADDLVRLRATEALARLPVPEAVSGVLRSGALRDDQVRELAKTFPAEVVIAGARPLAGGGVPEWQARRTAVELLADVAGDGLRLTLILRCVHDSDERVRLSAVRAAAASKNPRAIEPLTRVADDAYCGSEARSSLKDLTGENFSDAAAWKKWWDETGSKTIKVVDPRKTSWAINAKSVPRKEYENFLATLKKTGTGWFCAETTEGGVTGEDMKDPDGVLYKVQSTTDLEGTSHSIQKKP